MTRRTTAALEDGSNEEARTLQSRRNVLRGIGAVGLGTAAQSIRTADATGTTSDNPLTVDWSVDLSDTVAEYLVDGSQVHVATVDGRLRIVDARRGETADAVQFDANIPPYGLGTDGERFVVALSNGRLKILDDTLAVQSTIPYTGEFRGLAANGGSACVATDESVEHVSLDDGSVQWRRDFGKSPVWTTSEGYFTYVGEISPAVLSPDDGDVQWEQGNGYSDAPTGNWLSEGQYWGLSETSDYLGVTIPRQYGGRQKVYDKYTGEELFSENVGRNNGTGATSSTLGDGMFYYQSKNTIVAIDLDSGEQLWSTDIATAHAQGLTYFDESLVVFGTRPSDETPVIISLDPQSRAIRWERTVDSPIGLVSRLGNTVFGVDLRRNRLRAYTPGQSEIEIANEATPFPNNSVRGGIGSLDASSAQPPENASDGDEATGGDTQDEEWKSTDRASFLLTSKRTDVDVGDTVTLTLSAVNYVTADPMTVQLLLETPSGVEVVGVDGADEGSNQFTAVTEVDQGGEANVDITLRVNEPGTHDIGGKAIFYFGGDTSDGDVTEHSVTVSAGGVADSGGSSVVDDRLSMDSIVSAPSILGITALVGLASLIGVHRFRAKGDGDDEASSSLLGSLVALPAMVVRGPGTTVGEWIANVYGTSGAFGAVLVGSIISLGALLGASFLGSVLTLIVIPLGADFGFGEWVGWIPLVGVPLWALAAVGHGWYCGLQRISSGDYPERSTTGGASGQGGLSGDRKYESDEAERAHRQAQQREPPVDVGDEITLVAKEIEYENGEPSVMGKHRKFTIFVDQDVPSGISKGDTIRVQITNYGGGERGQPTAAHARFLRRA